MGEVEKNKADVTAAKKLATSYLNQISKFKEDSAFYDGLINSTGKRLDLSNPEHAAFLYTQRKSEHELYSNLLKDTKDYNFEDLGLEESVINTANDVVSNTIVKPELLKGYSDEEIANLNSSFLKNVAEEYNSLDLHAARETHQDLLKGSGYAYLGEKTKGESTFDKAITPFSELEEEDRNDLVEYVWKKYGITFEDDQDYDNVLKNKLFKEVFGEEAFSKYSFEERVKMLQEYSVASLIEAKFENDPIKDYLLNLPTELQIEAYRDPNLLNQREAFKAEKEAREELNKTQTTAKVFSPYANTAAIEFASNQLALETSPIKAEEYREKKLEDLEHKAQDLLNEDVSSISEWYYNNTLGAYNSGQINDSDVIATFENVMKEVSPEYMAFKGDIELENFTPYDMIKYLADYQAMSEKNPYHAAGYTQRNMQDYIAEQQGFWQRAGYTAQGLITGTTSLIVQGALGLYGLGVRTFDGAEAYAEFMDSKVVNLWNDIERYNTFSPTALEKARQYGVSEYSRIRKAGEEFDFWNVNTIYETLDMGKYILSGMVTGGITSLGVKGLGWLGKAANVTNKIQQGSKLYNALDTTRKLLVHSGQTLPMVQTMAKGSYDDTFQELSSKIDEKYNAELKDVANTKKTELIADYLSSSEIQNYINAQIELASKEYDKRVASLSNKEKSLVVDKKQYLNSVREEITKNLYNNAESNILNLAYKKYGKDLDNKKAEEIKMAEVAAGKAAATTATLTWLKEGAFNIIAGQWMFSEGNKFKFNNSKPEIKYTKEGKAIPTKTTLTKGNKALIAGRVALAQFGDEYLDSQIEAFSLGLGLNVHNNLIDGTYDPRGFFYSENGFVNFLNAVGSGVKSVSENLTSEAAIYEGLIGALSGVSPHVNWRTITKKKAAYARELGKESWKDLSFAEKLSKFFNNEILNDIIEAERDIEQAKLNADAINKAIQEQGKDAFDIHVLVSNLEKQQQAISEGRLIDAKDAKTRTGFELAHLVRDPKMKDAPQVQKLLQDIERLSKGEITEDDIKRFKFSIFNGGEAQNIDDATVAAKIKDNATKLKTLFESVDVAYKELENSKTGKQLSDITKKQLVYNKVYDKDVTDRLNSIEQSISGNTKFNSSTVEEADFSSVAGFNATRKAQQQIVNNLKQEIADLTEKTSKAPETVEEVLALFALNFKLNALKEALVLEEEYLAELDNKASEYKGSTRVLSEKEILALNPIQRAKMLDEKNLGNYSKEQQKIIKQTTDNLQKKNPDLLRDIKDAGELYQRRELNNQAYNKILNNEQVFLDYVDIMIKSFAERSVKAAEYIIAEQAEELLNNTKDKNLKKVIFDNKMSYAVVKDYAEKNPNRKNVLNPILDILKLYSDVQDFINNSTTIPPALKTTIKELVYPIIKKAKSSKAGMKALDVLIDQLKGKENEAVKTVLEDLLTNLEQLNHQRNAKVVNNRKKRQAELEEKRKKAEEEKKNKTLEGKKKLLNNLFSETTEKEGTKTTKFRIFKRSKDGTVKLVSVGGPSVSLSGKIAKEIKGFDGNENVDLTDIQILAQRQDTTGKYKTQGVDIQYRIKYDDGTKSSWIKASISLPSDFDVAEDIILESNQITLANEYNKQSSNTKTSDNDIVVDDSQPAEDVSLDSDGESMSPSLEEQAKQNEGVSEVQEVVDDVTDEGNNLNTGEGNMLGIPFTHYNSKILKDEGYMVPNDKSPKRGNAIDYAYEFYALVDKLGLNIADVIDYELPAILKENPDIQVHFMMTPLGSTSQHVIFNVIEYTDIVKKYHPNDNDLIYYGGKKWLVIGSSFANTNNYINLVNILKEKRSDYFNDNSTEDYYVSEAYTQVKETGSGRRVRRLEGEEETKQRKISELLYDGDNYNEQRNPHKLGNPKNKKDAYRNLKWAIRKRRSWITIGTKKEDDVIPVSSKKDNIGSVFILVPTTNNKLLPLYINPTFFNSISGSELEKVIIEALGELVSDNLESRKNAKDRLRELLVLTEKDNILIGDVDGKPALRIKINGTVRYTFFLGKDGNFNMQDFMRAISDLNPRINITASTLKNTSMMEMYDDAGVLTTDLAMLGTRNGSYTTYAVDINTGKPIIDKNDSIDNSNTDVKKSNSSKTKRIAYKGKQYIKTDGGWKDHNDVTITDAELILKLEYRELLNDKTPDYSNKGFNYYIIDDNPSEPIVIEEDSKGTINVLSKEESTNKINTVNKIKEAEAKRKEAEEFVDLEMSEKKTDKEVLGVNIEEQLQGNFGDSNQSVSIEQNTNTTNNETTKEVTKSTESSKSNEEKSLKELQDTKDLTTFEAIISKMSTRKKLKEIFKEKGWVWSNNVAEMANLLKSMNISITNISDVDTWLDIIKNCR